ncbi:MAG: type II secretion system minor pseudopilin GspI [Gammaproteobacteria bacterium]
MHNRVAAAGFTLLELLVALVIVALGLMAAFGQVNQAVTVASRLREKTFAHWIAVDHITRMRVLDVQPALGNSSDEVDMAGARWVYKVTVTKSDYEALRIVDVSVALADKPDTVLETVTGIVGKPSPEATGDKTDWNPLEPKT